MANRDTKTRDLFPQTIPKKFCRRCRTPKPERDFYPCKRQRLSAWCKKCESARKKAPEVLEKRRLYHGSKRLASIYKTTAAHIDQMIADQEGKCAICNVVPTRRLCIDHCHATGRIRAMLCGRCNRALGSFNDDPEILYRAHLYLLKHSRLKLVG